MSYNPRDARTLSHVEARQAAVDAVELAEQERELDEPDWRLITYWQRDALIHALLALSAGDS